MVSVKYIIFVILSCSVGVLQSQTYVGELLHGNKYQYAKIVVTDSISTFTLPYVDGDKKYQISGDVDVDGAWTIVRDFETWRFKTYRTNSVITGELYVNQKTQPVSFFQQEDALSKDELYKYEGIFEDKTGNRAIVYARNDYLHLISPFSKRTMSLKPTGKDTFWSVSGEVSMFEGTEVSKTSLTISDRFNESVTFRKQPPTNIEEVWIPVGKDTLYGKIFLPPSAENVPACLVLPGGGAVGMDNYEYEARYFAANGLAAMLFDKSGNGKSKGPGNFRLQTFEEKTTQYLQLYKYLQNHPSVDKTKVGVHGPSEGGRLALMMAIDDPEIAFVNATAAPIMNMRDGQLYAVQHYVRNREIAERDNAAIANIWDTYYQEIIDGEIQPQTIELANVYREKYERLFLPPNSTQVPGSPTASDLLNDRVAKEAGKISCPIFLQYGEKDERVNAQKSIQNFVEYAKEDLPIRVKLYPRANHSFMTPEFEISHGYLYDKKMWLQHIGIL
ncbi:alpha/beta hydrolase family protein [Marinirhabdus gelatinilytica]|uniref:Serine aminopeptidase S33 family n=1 Tax=Marinirhabdus gelatinilytica TaxID=1703343 RepID=A0A370QKI5_9FLAO|nr:alpha/beta hydrolase [Marinirhabdus gelatinilytica]RDK88878.1 serine aminopeptidase S33 family [Marinirhabdus gelatinilytica]